MLFSRRDLSHSQLSLETMNQFLETVNQGTLQRDPLAKQLDNPYFAWKILLTLTCALQADEYGGHKKIPTLRMRGENCSLNKLFLPFSQFGLLLPSVRRISSATCGFSLTILWPGRTSSRNNCFHLHLIKIFLYNETAAA